MRKLITITVAFVLMSALYAQDKKKDNKFSGNWAFAVANAPAGYASGKAEFKVKNDSTFVTFRMKEFSIYDLDVEVNGNKATIVFEAEDEDVLVTLTEKDGQLLGTAESPSIGELKINMVKDENKQQK